MKHMEGATPLTGPMTMSPHRTVLSLGDLPSKQCNLIMQVDPWECPPSCIVSHHAVLVEVCIKLVGAVSAAKAGEEEAEDVDGREAAVDGEER